MLLWQTARLFSVFVCTTALEINKREVEKYLSSDELLRFLDEMILLIFAYNEDSLPWEVRGWFSLEWNSVG